MQCKLLRLICDIIRVLEKSKNQAKPLHLEDSYVSLQQWADQFGRFQAAGWHESVGMNLKESNRWVKKAQMIPWLEIEKRYAALFTNRKGNVAKPLRLALGACIIQAEYAFSDEETALMIQENPYLQYFCGYPGYDDEKLPFDPSLMVYFRKRLTPEVLGEINEMIVRDAKKRQAKETKSKDDDDDSDNHPGAGGNSGTMIVDATCAPSNIRYPQDVSLLNEARENAEKLLDALHNSADGKKPRTYRERARKDYLKYTRCRKHTAKMTRKAIGKQLTYLRRDLDAVDGKLSLGKSLTTRQMERLDTIRTIYEQQKYMYDNRTHSVPDRIVSVSQLFVRPIVRGKTGKPVEFGAKLDISVVDGWTRLECCSFDAYNEAGNLQEMAEQFREREGHYPSRILADKIYRNRENLNYCKAHGIRLSGPALGRPRKGETRDKAQDYRDECERVEVERKFSLAKRKCGMGLVTAKLRVTVAHVIAMSVLVLNLRKIQCAILQLLAFWRAILLPKQKWTIVQ
ncbi:IS5 family transposase [Oscillibacter valericigenes]|uniref:IS5 family transposase n=1 Tax=Oscillibacter valericigenes TaxID=351091 RepID=UPI001F3477A8|nr:IS5 family transposase [Oscillibacter valericigenes]